MNKPELTYKNYPDDGSIEFFIDGEYITTWSYDSKPESSFDEFKLIFNAGYNYKENNHV